MTGICALAGDRVLPPTRLIQTSDGWVLALDNVVQSGLGRGQTNDAVLSHLHDDGVGAFAMLELDAVYELVVAKRKGLMIYETEGKRGNCVISARVPEIGADTLDLTGTARLDVN